MRSGVNALSAAGGTPSGDGTRERTLKYYMRHVTCHMKVVQTELSEPEYALLAEYARRRSDSIKNVVREAIRRLALSEEVDPDDPIFKLGPLVKRTGKTEDLSDRHDHYLYGWDR